MDVRHHRLDNSRRHGLVARNHRDTDSRRDSQSTANRVEDRYGMG